MATIHDYLRWRGDLSFGERPFNVVDNIVLSAMAYLDFTGIVPSEDEGGDVLVKDACAQLLERAGDDIAPFVRSLAKIDEEFVRLLTQSDRFGNARLRGYKDVVDKEQALQFAAMQVELPHAGTYVAFRGTDNTIVGWRENFMLSFTVTAAQREAAHYLRRALGRLSEGRSVETHGQSADDAQDARAIYVGGHSKGGTLAEFAARSCTDQEQSLITRVYSNDGPGMAEEVILAQDNGLDPTGRQPTDDKLIRIVPTYSVIGMLFAEDDEPRTIVKSSENGISQHDLTTWQVTRDGLEEADHLQRDCLLANQVIARWMQEYALDERAQVITDVFDALEAGGATSFDQIVSSPEQLQRVLHALSQSDDKTREVALSLIQSAVDSSVEAVRTAARQLLAKGANLTALPHR